MSRTDDREAAFGAMSREPRQAGSAPRDTESEADVRSTTEARVDVEDAHRGGLPAGAPDEQMYPCDDCGKLRTKAEGGTTFTVCEKCWEKLYPPDVGTAEHPAIAETPYDVEALLREVREVVQPAPVLPDRWERRGGAWRCEGCGAWLTNKEGASGDHGRDDGHGNETQCGPVTFWSPAPALPDDVRAAIQWMVHEMYREASEAELIDVDRVRDWLAHQGSDISAPVDGRG